MLLLLAHSGHGHSNGLQVQLLCLGLQQLLIDILNVILRWRILEAHELDGSAQLFGAERCVSIVVEVGEQLVGCEALALHPSCSCSKDRNGPQLRGCHLRCRLCHPCQVIFDPFAMVEDACRCVSFIGSRLCFLHPALCSIALCASTPGASATFLDWWLFGLFRQGAELLAAFRRVVDPQDCLVVHPVWEKVKVAAAAKQPFQAHAPCPVWHG
mmetsp:Transcript_95218/g.226723  ORF Transcript_95218/g.226723 Transcript_95218/m.226723 type:complete len:213 (-) Transcript_95218:1540-2178(-)